MTKHFWIYTHNFTHSGAPLVMASIARQLAALGWRDRLRVVSWGGLHDRRHSTLQNGLSAEGIRCSVLDHHQSPPKPSHGDQLLLNSLVLPEHVIQQALAWRSQHRLSRLDWYAHEGNPSVLLTGTQWPKEVSEALQNGDLKLRVPSEKTLHAYQNWLSYKGSSLLVQTPQVQVDCGLISQACSDFSSLRLQLTGAVGYGEKGHLWLVKLIEKVLSISSQDRQKLRPIYLTFIGIERGAYSALARSVSLRAKQLLGDRFECVGQVSRREAIQAMAKSNIAVSCSLSETFSLVIGEAMALGQLILRNRTGGFEEQLIDNVNGFDLGLPGFPIHQNSIDLLCRLRNPNEISDNQLQQMQRQAALHAQQFLQADNCNWLIDS